MGRIIVLLIFASSIISFVSCKNGCRKRNVAYREDIMGIIEKIVPEKDLEYYRISAKDFSSWGFRNKTGGIVIPLDKYEFLNPIDEQGMILAHKDGKGGYIDITEKILIPFIYDNIGVFSACTGLAPVIKNGKQGFVNRKGDIAIPLEYDASHVTHFYEPGVAILVKSGKYGVIGIQNNIIIPFEYDNIEWSDSKDFFIILKGTSWTNFSVDGKQISGDENCWRLSHTVS